MDRGLGLSSVARRAYSRTWEEPLLISKRLGGKGASSSSGGGGGSGSGQFITNTSGEFNLHDVPEENDNMQWEPSSSRLKQQQPQLSSLAYRSQMSPPVSTKYVAHDGSPPNMSFSEFRPEDAVDSYNKMIASSSLNIGENTLNDNNHSRQNSLIDHNDEKFFQDDTFAANNNSSSMRFSQTNSFSQLGGGGAGGGGGGGGGGGTRRTSHRSSRSIQNNLKQTTTTAVTAATAAASRDQRKSSFSKSSGDSSSQQRLLTKADAAQSVKRISPTAQTRKLPSSKASNNLILTQDVKQQLRQSMEQISTSEIEKALKKLRQINNLTKDTKSLSYPSHNANSCFSEEVVVDNIRGIAKEIGSIMQFTRELDGDVDKRYQLKMTAMQETQQTQRQQAKQRVNREENFQKLYEAALEKVARQKEREHIQTEHILQQANQKCLAPRSTYILETSSRKYVPIHERVNFIIAHKKRAISALSDQRQLLEAAEHAKAPINVSPSQFRQSPMSSSKQQPTEQTRSKQKKQLLRQQSASPHLFQAQQQPQLQKSMLKASASVIKLTPTNNACKREQIQQFIERSDKWNENVKAEQFQRKLFHEQQTVSEATFKPKINKNAGILSPKWTPIDERLNEIAEQSENKRLVTLNAERHRMPFQPLINKHSQQLVANSVKSENKLAKLKRCLSKEFGDERQLLPSSSSTLRLQSPSPKPNSDQPNPLSADFPHHHQPYRPMPPTPTSRFLMNTSSSSSSLTQQRELPRSKSTRKFRENYALSKDCMDFAPLTFTAKTNSSNRSRFENVFLTSTHKESTALAAARKTSTSPSQHQTISAFKKPKHLLNKSTSSTLLLVHKSDAQKTLNRNASFNAPATDLHVNHSRNLIQRTKHNQFILDILDKQDSNFS